MGPLPRRERWSIIGAILAAIDEQVRDHGAEARITNVALRANIAYDRMQDYLNELVQAGLVTPDRMPRLTPKGYDFLRQYKQWLEVLQRFGI